MQSIGDEFYDEAEIEAARKELNATDALIRPIDLLKKAK